MKKYVDNPPKKNTKINNGKQTGYTFNKVKKEYIKIYSNIGFLRALDILFRLPNNETTLRQIKNFNIQLKTYNKRNNKKESIGAVPIRELAKFYTRAHKVIKGFEEANNKD